MNNLCNRLMKGVFLALCLATLCSTLSIAQIQRSLGLGKMVLTTAKGETVYEHNTLSTIANFPKEGYSFYFKVHAFKSSDKAANANLVSVLDANNYSIVAFDGTFAQPLKRPAPGSTGAAILNGTLKVQGKEIKTSIPVRTRLNEKGYLVMESTLDIDQNGTADAKAAAAKLGVTKPISLTITATY